MSEDPTDFDPEREFRRALFHLARPLLFGGLLFALLGLAPLILWLSGLDGALLLLAVMAGYAVVVPLSVEILALRDRFALAFAAALFAMLVYDVGFLYRLEWLLEHKVLVQRRPIHLDIRTWIGLATVPRLLIVLPYLRLRAVTRGQDRLDQSALFSAAIALVGAVVVLLDGAGHYGFAVALLAIHASAPRAAALAESLLDRLTQSLDGRRNPPETEPELPSHLPPATSRGLPPRDRDRPHTGPGLEDGLAALLSRPRGEQPEAIRALLADLEPEREEEAWNTAFGPDSLFDAWTRTTVCSSLHLALRGQVRTALAGRERPVVIEIGAGDGALWRGLASPESDGALPDGLTLHVIDPVAEAHEALAASLPTTVERASKVAAIEEVVRFGSLPEADLVICSLTLHHLAGADRSERESVGLEGPGKLEVLAAIAEALRAREGRLLLAEADIHCDVAIAPGDPLLTERLLDSYVRRCGASLLVDLEGDAPAGLKRRWRAILRRWCLEQLAMAEVPIAERDVYELDVPRWLALLERAGLDVERRRFTDAWNLFHLYECRPGPSDTETGSETGSSPSRSAEQADAVRAPSDTDAGDGSEPTSTAAPKAETRPIPEDTP